jgi:selenocysteine-specific elongation factor
VLERPIAAAVGDAFVLRDTTAQRTIGGGRFLDLRPPSRRRRTPERMAQLDAHAIVDPEGALAALLERPPYQVDIGSFARDRALSPDDVAAMIEHLGVVEIQTAGGAIGLSIKQWAAFRRRLIGFLESFHAANPDLPGIGVERLRLEIEPRLAQPVFGAALKSLAQESEVALDGAWVKLPSHEPKLTSSDEDVWHEIAPLLGGAARFRPPRVRDISSALTVAEAEVRRILKLVARMGKVDEVAHDHFFLRSTMAEIAAIISDLAAAAPQGFTAAQLRDRLDNGRKVAIHILEFLDRHGVTLRRGDLRRINKHRIDLFGNAPDRIDAVPLGRESSPVGRPDFKSGRGREPVFGGFDSHSLPPRPGAGK